MVIEISPELKLQMTSIIIRIHNWKAIYCISKHYRGIGGSTPWSTGQPLWKTLNKELDNEFV